MIIGTENLIILTADLTTDNTVSENVKYCVSYNCGLIEIAKIELTPQFYWELLEKPEHERKLYLFQMISTPVVHQNLLATIAKFVEDVKETYPLDVKESLEAWLTQTNSLISSPTKSDQH